MKGGSYLKYFDILVPKVFSGVVFPRDAEYVIAYHAQSLVPPTFHLLYEPRAELRFADCAA